MATNTTTPATNTLTLRDGRTLAYTDCGDPSGRPVVIAQGTPASRYLTHPDESIARRIGLRLLTPDRPGYGLSTYRRGLTLLTWANDVAQLADTMGWNQFDVIGYSGGGPSALACAAAMPTRVRRLALVAGMGQLADPEVRAALTSAGDKTWVRLYAMARRTPQSLIRLLSEREARNGRKAPARYVEEAAKQMPEVDRATLAQPGVREMILLAFSEAFRQGALGYSADAKLLTRPWGFDPRAIQTPTHIWQGEADRNVLPVLGHSLASVLPNSTPTFLPEDGHFSLYLNHWSEILADLAG